MTVYGKPPHRIAGIPPGVISADDYDVTDEAMELLAAVSTFTSFDADSLVPSMSEIKQIRAPGRERPYITIVDTGLVNAASLFIGMLETWLREALAEGDTLEDVIEKNINWDRVNAIFEGLQREQEERTF